MFKYFTPVLMAIALTACQGTSKEAEAEKVNNAPPVCWFYQPVNGDIIGSVGVARNLSAGGPKRVQQLAKQKALKGLAAYVGNPELSSEQLNKLVKADTQKVDLQGHSVHFVDQIQWQGYYYQYAVLDAPQDLSVTALRENCSQECEPKICNPSWLCDPMTDEEAGFLGVSFRATSLPHQYGLAVRNAIAQLKYMYGVEVATKGWFYRSADSMSSYRLRVNQVDVDLSQEAPKDLRFLVTNSCYIGEQLFVRVGVPDLEPIQHSSGQDWLKNPNLFGYEGAVGSASMTTDGLISSQIELAAKRALGELLGSQNKHISDTVTISQNGKGRSIQIELQTEGKGTVVGKVMGIYLEPQDSYRIRVYVWVVKSNK